MVFQVKKEKAAAQDFTIAGMRGVRVKKGHVGIELECEGRNLPKQDLGGYWTYTRDGSLRGQDNAEYLLQRPIDFEEVDKAVAELWAIFKKNKSVLDESVRTSVHVHLNVLPFYQNRLASLLTLWFLFEDVLSMWCGDHRAGNLFCIRAKDGPAIIEQIKGWFENRGVYGLDSEGLHYAALNLAALQDHGSVEIRTMRGVTEPGPLLQWVRILQKIYEASETFTDPRTIIEDFSMAGPHEFFQRIFGDEAEGILRALPAYNLRDSLYEGMRFAQDFVYVRDWSDFNPAKVIADPFGRKTKATVRGGLADQQAPPDGMPDADEWRVDFTEVIARPGRLLNVAPRPAPRPRTMTGAQVLAELNRIQQEQGPLPTGYRTIVDGRMYQWSNARHTWDRVRN